MAAHLVELLLPLRDNAGQAYPAATFDGLRDRLVHAFGGVTVFARAPGEGLWRGDGAVSADDVVVFEIMVERLDPAWWGRLRRSLERELGQSEIVVRATPIERL